MEGPFGADQHRRPNGSYVRNRRVGVSTVWIASFPFSEAKKPCHAKSWRPGRPVPVFLGKRNPS